MKNKAEGGLDPFSICHTQSRLDDLLSVDGRSEQWIESKWKQTAPLMEKEFPVDAFPQLKFQ